MSYLFDLDGLLINSEELYLEANREYFAQFGFEFTEALHKQGTGKKFAEWVKTVTDIDLDGATILAERNKVYYRLAKTKLKLLPGAKEVLTYAETHGKTALVTSSNKDYVDIVFDRTGIADYFNFVVAGDQVTKGKPDPEGYLSAAKALGVLPNSCVVFEDAPNGVEAGKNAGMKVVAVPSPFVVGDPIFETADLLLKSLADYPKNEYKLRDDGHTQKAHEFLDNLPANQRNTDPKAKLDDLIARASTTPVPKDSVQPPAGEGYTDTQTRSHTTEDTSDSHSDTSRQ